MNADVDDALAVWRTLNRDERSHAIGILAWNNPNALIAAAAAAKSTTLVDHTPDY